MFENQNCLVSLYVSECMKETLQSLADIRGVSMSCLIREALYNTYCI